MPTFVNVCRLSVYFSLCLTVTSLYLPTMKSQTGSKRHRNLPVFVNMAARAASSYHHNKGLSDQEDAHSLRNKRGLSDFSKVMSRHATKHKNDQIFVDRMFKLFDLDGDRVINRREFKLVLQILRIVDHNF